jgi:hypothetical protein
MATGDTPSGCKLVPDSGTFDAEASVMPQLPGGRRFVHRKNADGSFDSICANCFRTTARRKIEAELEQAERDHICAPENVNRADEWLSDLPEKGAHKVVEFPLRKGCKAG